MDFQALPSDIQERINTIVAANKIQAQCRVFLLRKQTNVVGKFYMSFPKSYRNYVSLCASEGMRMYDKVMYVLCEHTKEDHEIDDWFHKDIDDLRHDDNLPWRTIGIVNQRGFSRREIDEMLIPWSDFYHSCMCVWMPA